MAKTNDHLNKIDKTTTIQVSESEVETILKSIQHKFYRLPFYQFRVPAGTPTPGEYELERKLELNEYLIRNPDTTFFLKVSGSSMIKAGIHHNDILVVDRALEPINGKIVVASLNGELTVKRLHYNENRLYLMPENDDFKPIEVTEYTELRIWGVVTSVIHQL